METERYLKLRAVNKRLFILKTRLTGKRIKAINRLMELIDFAILEPDEIKENEFDALLKDYEILFI